MDPVKQAAREAAGWRVGTVAEFLALSDEERAEVERRVAKLQTRSAGEARRIAFMVEGDRKEELR